jgi:hypothetical protein
MRLVVFGGPWSVWSRLEPETAEERMVIEACLARGESITGSGVEAIPTLRALAARIGYPIESLDPRVTVSPSPRLVVVRRDEATLHTRLAALTREGLTVIWDRRHGERRTVAVDRPLGVNRRQRDRRRRPPVTWATLGFLVARSAGPAPPSQS